MAKKVMLLLMRIAVAGVFLTAGVMKIWDFRHGGSATQDFAIAIHSFQLRLPPDLVILIAVYLPWLEVIAALALFFRRLALGASTATLGLSAIFLGVISSAWWRGLNIGCGCFGEDTGPSNYLKMILLRLIGEDTVPPNFPRMVLFRLLLLGACVALFAYELRRNAATAAGSSTVSSTPAPEA